MCLCLKEGRCAVRVKSTISVKTNLLLFSIKDGLYKRHIICILYFIGIYIWALGLRVIICML
jgi:hypothetical protein